MRRTLQIIGLAALLGACQHAGEPERAAAPATIPSSVETQQGYVLAQAACSQCHSIERVGLSPVPDAPEWPVIANTPGLTRETLTAWLTEAHNYPEQMDFYLEEDEVEMLVDYMLTLQSEDYHPPYQ